jgi:hypothetical protein
MEDSIANGWIEVSVVSDSSDASLSNKKATLSVQDVMSVTELSDGKGARIVLFEVVHSSVPWVFRDDGDDVTVWRTLVVDETRSTIDDLMVLARRECRVVSQADLDRLRVASYTLDHDVSTFVIHIDKHRNR